MDAWTRTKVPLETSNRLKRQTHQEVVQNLRPGGGGCESVVERKNPKPSQPHIGGKACGGGTGSNGAFFSDGAGATGCTATTLGVMRNSSWGVTGFTGTTRPTENLIK